MEKSPISRREFFKAGVVAVGVTLLGKDSTKAETNDLNDVRAQAQIAYRQGVDAENLLINFAGNVMGQRFYVPGLEERRLIFEDAVDRVAKGEDPLGESLWLDKLTDPEATQPVPSIKP